MKKGLVILVALAFIGGVVFAEEPATVKIADPTITYGVTSYLGVNAFTNNTDLEDVAGGTDQAAVSAPRFGSLPSDTTYYSGYGYHVQPWVKIASGPFSVNLAPMFFGAKDDKAEIALSRYEATFGVAGTGYSIYDRMRYENKTTAGTSVTNHRIKGDFSLDNLSAGVVFTSSSAANTGTFDDFFRPYTSLSINDYMFGIKDFWGFMDVKVGGASTDYYYPTNNYRLGAIDWFAANDKNVASSNAPADQGFRWIGIKGYTIPINTTFNIGKLIEVVPLTIRTGVSVPITVPTAVPAVEWRDFLAYDQALYVAGGFKINQTPIIASATFAMEGIGTFDAGIIPGMAYTKTTNVGAVYTKATTDVTNIIFADANISAIENLQLQAAVDFKTQTSPSADPAATTGTGAAATPFVTSKVTTTNLWFGLEAIYDLSAVLKGLEVDGGLAIASQTGQTALNQTGTAWAAPTAGTGVYIASNYNEASAYGAMENFIFGVGVSYAINDNNSVSFSDNFTNMAGDFGDLDAAAGVTSYGFYNTNAIGLGYSVTAGKGKLSTSLGYTMFLGLPAASDYGITGTNAIAAYDVALANTFKPLSFRIKYSAKY